MNKWMNGWGEIEKERVIDKERGRMNKGVSIILLSQIYLYLIIFPQKNLCWFIISGYCQVKTETGPHKKETKGRSRHPDCRWQGFFFN